MKIMRRWWVIGLSGLAAILASGMLRATPPGQPAAAGQSPSGLMAASAGPEDAALVRELAERLLTPRFAGPAVETPPARLLPGALPEGLPLVVPLPDGGRLIGSVTRPIFPRGTLAPAAEGVEVVIVAPGEVAAVATKLEEALAGQGWAARNDPQAPGFVPAARLVSRTLCADAYDGGLLLQVWPDGDGSNDVRLILQPGANLSCGPPAAPLARPPVGVELIPQLVAPEGVALRPGPAGGTDAYSSVYTVARTDLNPADLLARFEMQLAAVGWRRDGGDAHGLLAWSVWSVPVEGEAEWQGFIRVLAGPTPALRTVEVQVVSPRAASLPFSRS